MDVDAAVRRRVLSAMSQIGLARRSAFALDRVLVERRWRRALAAQFGATTADLVLARTWREYLVRLASMPRHGAEGSRLVQRWTLLALALYRALRSRGLGEDVSRAALRTLLWDGMRVIGRVAWLLAWWPGRAPLERTQRAMRHFRRLFFTTPGFEWREVPAQAGRVGLDCVRCPIARRFAAEGLADVAVHAICSLDRRLAADWGVRFTRSQTLADGGTHCDFRWVAVPIVRQPAERGRPPAQ